MKKGNEMATYPHGHRERLRNRFAHGGFEALTEVEAVELLVAQAIPQGDIRERAEQLLRAFGSFEGILDAAPEALMSVSGIKEAAAFSIKFHSHVVNHYTRRKMGERPKMNTTEAVATWVRSHATFQEEESFALYLAGDYKLRKMVLLQRGTPSSVPVYRRQIVEQAAKYAAEMFIFVHTHTADSTAPSREDVEISYLLMHTLDTVETSMIDHVIVSPTQQLSLRESRHVDFSLLGLNRYIADQALKAAQTPGSLLIPGPLG